MVSWSSLTGGSSSGSVTVASPHQDLTTGRLVKRGKVLMYDTFNSGTREGWNPALANAGVANAGLSTTTYPTMSGSHALMLSTQEAPYVENAPGTNCAGYKRLVNYQHGALAGGRSLSMFFSVFTGGFATEHGFGMIGMGMDTQWWNNSNRCFYKAMVQWNSGTPSNDAAGGTSGFFKAYLAKNATSGGGSTPIDATNMALTGLNENKGGLNYLRLTVDDSLNGGLGGYVELQINNKVFNLSFMGSERGQQDPQTNAAFGTIWGDYNGGLNPGVWISQRPSGAAAAAYPNHAWPSWMVVDSILLTEGDVYA